MPLRGPNWLSQVWHWPEQLGWGQSVATILIIIDDARSRVLLIEFNPKKFSHIDKIMFNFYVISLKDDLRKHTIPYHKISDTQ